MNFKKWLCFWCLGLLIVLGIVSCSDAPGSDISSSSSSDSSAGQTLLPTGPGVYVATNGNDTNTGLTKASPVLSIQSAINIAQSNNLNYVFIQEGYYTTNAGLSNENTSIIIRSNGLTVYGGCDSSFTPISGHFSILDGQYVTWNILVLWSTTNVTLYGLTIMRGSTGIISSGAGCFITNSMACRVTNCNFIQNRSLGSGGGIALITSTSNSVCSVFISNSTASLYTGGGLLIRSSSYNRVHSTFIGNIAGNGGGAIYVYDNSSSNTISGIMISNAATNTGSAGGAIRLDGVYNNILDDCTINYNMINGSGGGGLYSTSTGTKILNSSFTGNTANNYGGGCHITGTNHFISNCVFSENRVTNTPGLGGGICILSYANTILYSTFSNNFVNNYGGGIYSSGSNTIISNCLIFNNQATNSTQTGVGGGIALSGRDSQAAWCVISSNFGDTGGGAAFTVNAADGYASLLMCTVSGNAATAYGAGLYISNGAFIDHNGFFDNGNISYPIGGGGIYALNSWGSNQFNIISNNHAVRGRGMWIENSALTNNNNAFVNYGVNILLKGNSIDGGLKFEMNSFAGPGYGSILDCTAFEEESPDTTNHIFVNNTFITNKMGYLYFEVPSAGVTNRISNADFNNINNINFTGAKISSGNTAAVW